MKNLIFAILATYLISSIIFNQNNNLLNNTFWESLKVTQKMDPDLNDLGRRSIFTQNQLNFGIANSFLSLSSKIEINFQKIEFDFEMDPETFFDFEIFQKKSDSLLLRFSTFGNQFSINNMTIDQEGAYKKNIPLFKSSMKKMYHFLIEKNHNELILNLNNQKISLLKEDINDYSKIGLKGEIGNVNIKNFKILNFDNSIVKNVFEIQNNKIKTYIINFIFIYLINLSSGLNVRI